LEALYYPSKKKPIRKVVLSPKFYFFDIGIANYLLKRKHIEWGTLDAGRTFEHFIYMELKAYTQYSAKKISHSILAYFIAAGS